jgi:hypothetical protein
MSGSWQTIEQAAVTLKLSVRTINRHISAGKLESRLNEGRREVLVNALDASHLPNPESFNDPAPVGASQSNIDAETVLALADNAAEKAEMAVTAYQTLARVADGQVRQARRGARVAWAAVVLMAAGVTVAVGWTTHRLTRANAEIDRLQREVQTATDTRSELVAKADTLVAEKFSSEQTLHTELTSAREQAARAEGQLAAYREQETLRQTRVASIEVPATQPRTLVGKVDAPTTRRTTLSDVTSASTAEE